MTVGSSFTLAVFLMYRISSLKFLTCCHLKFFIKLLSVSLGLSSSLNELLMMSAKEISVAPPCQHQNGRAVGEFSWGRVADGKGGREYLFWRSCQGVWWNGTGEPGKEEPGGERW